METDKERLGQCYGHTPDRNSMKEGMILLFQFLRDLSTSPQETTVVVLLMAVKVYGSSITWHGPGNRMQARNWSK